MRGHARPHSSAHMQLSVERPQEDCLLKMLIAEDDFASRLLMQEYLKKFGSPHIAVNGKEAVMAVSLALEKYEPYDLICLDIMMPEMDGHQALREIRALEQKSGNSRRSKIIMTTALVDHRNVMDAVREKCDYFLVKPIRKAALLDQLRVLSLIE